MDDQPFDANAYEREQAKEAEALVDKRVKKLGDSYKQSCREASETNDEAARRRQAEALAEQKKLVAEHMRLTEEKEALSNAQTETIISLLQQIRDKI